MSNFVLSGLSGNNPLAFLAALGTLRVCDSVWRNGHVRLGWIVSEGSWRPNITIDGELDRSGLIKYLDEALRNTADHGVLLRGPGVNSESSAGTDISIIVSAGAFGISSDLNIPCSEFRKIAASAQNVSSLENRSYCDFISAFGSEVVESEKNGKRTGNISDTALRTIGGGRQRFLDFIRELVLLTTEKDLEDTLFHAWLYLDDGPSMRWDPSDDRRYALRWKEPSGDPIKTMRGANRLAIEGLPLLTTAPVGRHLATTGFTRMKDEGTVWTWPIWTGLLSLDPVRSILALSELQEEKPKRSFLERIGVAEVFRCQRITEGKYRNLTPAWCP